MTEIVKIPFVKSKSEVPVIPFYRNGKHLYALVDTGSESTLFDNSIVDDGTMFSIELEREMDFIGLNGKTEKKPIRGVTSMVNMNGLDVQVSGINADLTSIRNHLNDMYDEDIRIDAVFGADFLGWYLAKIDFDKREIILHDNGLSGK